ncbi:MAG: sugar ABC transporter substrate-binding protein, partial [SAR324 cluster bacterium]|nr:sugar ABC transporter substrate-binding protein [SAR324 cluster bacterium]
MMLKNKVGRRKFLKNSATAAAGSTALISGSAAILGGKAEKAMAGSHKSLRKDILKIPGVGMGSPTDADWQKVGEMCLGGTKERVKPG